MTDPPERGLLDTSVPIASESGRRLNVNGLWIAATALAHQLPVVTQDDDFDLVDGVAGLEIVRV